VENSPSNDAGLMQGESEGTSLDFEPRFFNPRNDVAFKKVFVNHAELTKSFLNSTLRLEGSRKIQTVEFLPTERLPMTAESKKSILDVLCTDEKGSQYIIEVQNKSMLNYVQRAQYYASHLYVGQLEVAENYLTLKPVTLLSLLNHCIFPNDVGYLSFHHNIERETKVGYLNDMSYAFVELPKFTKKEEDLETAEDYWIFMMKEATHLREAPEHAPEEVKQAYAILERHTWTRSERLAYEQAKIGLMDDMEAIRTAKEEGREEGREEGEQIGIAKGEQIGIAKGEQIGIAKGEQTKAVTIARKALDKGMSVQDTSELTGLSVKEIEEL
jgi:predicted transposase/invertase (TIGR01784 family)